jgi:uncharacterized protein YecT (DUF1311 family)
MKLTMILFILLFSIDSFSQTQLEMNSDSYHIYEDADKELNLVYQQILKDYANDSLFISKLKISQRIWVKFRDAELEMKFPEEEKRVVYGSMYPMCESSYLKRLTIARTEKLKEWLKQPLKHVGCNGSIMFREDEDDKD